MMKWLAALTARTAREAAVGRLRIAVAYRRMAAAGSPHAVDYLLRADHFEMLATRAQRLADAETEYVEKA